MRRPLHPSQLGIHEPKKVYTKKEYLPLRDAYSKLSLETVLKAWEKALRDHKLQNHRIVEGPHLESSSSYGSLTLTYTYEWDNLHYNEEMSCYSATLNEWAEKKRLFEEAEAKRKKTPSNLDDKIVRAERRLANLKAAKAGEPLPFPNE